MGHAGFTILLVDDEPDAREVLSLALGIEGYPVVQAANGQEALDMLKNIDRLPSLIALDLAMPVLDGPGFLAQRVQDSTLASIPVIVVSGHTGFLLSEGDFRNVQYIRDFCVSHPRNV